jgi:hypothetical protein
MPSCALHAVAKFPVGEVLPQPDEVLADGDEALLDRTLDVPPLFQLIADTAISTACS